jgi:electron transport complex protein RnfC
LTVAARSPGSGRRPGELSRLWRRFLAVPEARFPLAVQPVPLREMPAPETLTFFLGRSDVRGPFVSPAALAGAEVGPGQALGTLGDVPLAPSPVPGTVREVRQVPDLRGGKPGLAVVLAPSGPPAAPFSPLDPVTFPPETLRARLHEAGLGATIPAAADAVIVLAADPEPGLSSALHLLREDPGAAARATAFLARLAGAERACLAVPERHESSVRAEAGASRVELVPLGSDYPDTLPEVVARQVSPSGPRPPVIPLAVALAALAAVERGEVPSTRVLTVIGPDGAPAGNFRVPLGIRLGDVFLGAGLTPVPGDKVIVGGLLRGLAQYSLDAAVDLSVDGVALVKAGTFPAWTDEPCINCGSCVDVCPESLAAHQIVRYSEFSLFDRTPEFGLHECIECGLCATVCPARRPMLQRIRLAKREVAATAAAEAEALAAASSVPPSREPDPISVPVATAKKD